MHMPLWLKPDQETRTTDCTGEVWAVNEFEHKIASSFLQLGRQLQRPNWCDWLQICCHMFPQETDNEPVNWCRRQISCYCFLRKVLGENIYFYKWLNLQNWSSNFLQHSILWENKNNINLPPIPNSVLNDLNDIRVGGAVCLKQRHSHQHLSHRCLLSLAPCGF